MAVLRSYPAFWLLAAAMRGVQGLYLAIDKHQVKSEPYWPTKGGNLNHSGYADFVAPFDLSKPSWEFEEPHRERKGRSNLLMKVFHSSPVIDGAFNVYIQSTTGWIYSVDKQGRLRWEFETSSGNPGNLALDGTSVYTISDDGTAFAVDAATGSERWRRKAADHAPDDTHSLTVSGDTLLTGCSVNRSTTHLNNAVCALSTIDGQMKWAYNMVKASHRSDAMATNQVQSVSDGKVIFADGFGGVFCVSLDRGQELWQTQAGTSLQRIHETHGMEPYGSTATAVLGPNRLVYHPFNVAGGSGTIRAHRLRDGGLAWQRSFDLEANVAPAVGRVQPGGRLVAVLPLGRNPTGLEASPQEKKAFAAGQGAAVEARVVALDAATGETVWTFTLPRWDGRCAGSRINPFGSGDLCAPDNFGAPSIGADGTVYLNWSGGYAYAVRDANGDGVIDIRDGEEVSSYHHGYGSNGATALAPGLAVAPSCRKLLAFAA